MLLLLALPLAPSGAREALEPTHGGGGGGWRPLGQDRGVASWLASIRTVVTSVCT